MQVPSKLSYCYNLQIQNFPHWQAGKKHNAKPGFVVISSSV